MNVQEIVERARDQMRVGVVFGDPLEKNGVTIIPAAKVQGGGGGGSGGQGEQHGEGGGFGVNARPVGAYIIKGDTVTWQPAIDMNRVILGGQAVGIVALLVFRSLVRARQKRTRKQG